MQLQKSSLNSFFQGEAQDLSEVSAGRSPAAHDSDLSTIPSGLCSFLVPFPHSPTKRPKVTSQISNLSRSPVSVPAGTHADTAHCQRGPEKPPLSGSHCHHDCCRQVCRSPPYLRYVPRPQGHLKPDGTGPWCYVWVISHTLQRRSRGHLSFVLPGFMPRCFLCLTTIVL